jgi:hypothetical protein
MSSSVININHDIAHDKLDILLSAQNIKYVHVNHKDAGFPEKNIIEISKNNQIIKNLLVKLTNYGFMTYVLRDGVSSLVHYSSVKNLWLPVKNKEFSVSANNIVYVYEDAEISLNKHLVVMFYPIAPNPNSASLNRYFPSNFTTLKNYISKSFSILRIADLGGISGAFYMNTEHLANNEKNIQSLIKEITERYGIAKENVVLYGASKGGTGALYHSLIGGYASISVDPILDDEHYLANLNDLHNVSGVFPEDKSQKFSCVLHADNITSSTTIITSSRSEQYKYIIPRVDSIRDRIQILNNINPKILTHPDVAPNSIHAILATLNMFSFGIRATPGEKVIM